MALAYLLDPTKQYQNRAGVNNVSGWLEVFRMDTDTRATVYSDFAGTVAPARIGIDNNGRAVMIVESGVAYRVEMYGPEGDLIFTQQPIYTQASGGGIGSLTRVESTDGSIGVESSTVGSVVTYDLSVAKDGSDLLEFVRCDGAERIQNTDIFRPTYTDGTMAVGNQGILLGEGRYYHITAHIRASKNQQREPFYDRIFIGVQTNDGTTTTPITRTSEIIDYSLGLTQDFEFSTDVFAQSDCELELFVTGQDVLGGDIEVLDIEAHRIFSGSPAIPSGVLSRAQAANLYQRQLIAGANITIEETEEGDIISAIGGGGSGGATYQGGEGIVVNNTTYRISIDDSVVQEKLTAGDNITIEDNVISATVPSVDISGKADKVEDAVNGNLAGLDSNGNLTDSGIAADRVVQDASYVHTDQNFTTELKNKLVNIEAGAQVNVQSDWLEESSSSDAYIRNKPDMSQYATQSDLSGKADKVSGAVNGNLAGLDSTGNLTDSGIRASDVATQSDLADKQDTLIAGNNITIVDNVISATGGGSFTQVQSDWDETNPSDVSFILNKPAIPSGNQLLPAATSADEDKVLTVDSNGDPVWAASQGTAQVQSDWIETNTSDVSYIQHKPAVKPIVAGSGISITENAANVTIAATGGGGGGGATYTAGNGINIDQNNEISVDTTVVATQSDLASYTPTASLATVATTGAYSDLSGTPTIPTVDQTYSASSANAQSGVAVAQAMAGISLDEVPAVTSSDDGKVLTASYSGGVGTYSWQVSQGGGTNHPDLPALAPVTSKDVFRFEFETSSYNPSTDSDVSGLGTWTQVTADPSRNVWDLEASAITNGFKDKFTSSKSLFKVLDCYARTKNMSNYFNGCTGLTSFYGCFMVGSTSTNQYRNMSYMFYGCTNLERIELHEHAISMDGYSIGSSNSYEMCAYCVNLKYVSFCGLNSSVSTNYLVAHGSLSEGFLQCSKLERIDGLRIGSATDLSRAFKDCVSLQTLTPYTGFNCSGSAASAFENCYLLNTPIATCKATNFNSTFKNCYRLVNIGVIDLADCTDASSVLSGCYSLEEARILNTSGVINMANMLYQCSSLIKLPELDYTSVTNVQNAFASTPYVSSGQQALYNTLSANANITNYSGCFTNCGVNSSTGSAELAQIPTSWGGTMS